MQRTIRGDRKLRRCCRGKALAGLVAFALLATLSCKPRHSDRLIVGSKNFTEQVVLGEMMAQHIEARLKVPVERRFYLAGSYIAHQAVASGRIDLYPEYTGTALMAILKQSPQGDDAEQVYNKVRGEYDRRFKLAVEPPFGFNNTFAMIIRGDEARRLRISNLSQAAAYSPQWKIGVGYEFLERADGFKGMVKKYDLKFAGSPRVMDLGLLYRALKEKQVDMIAANSTDGLIAALDLAVLADDLHYFPPYQAVPVVVQDALTRFPALEDALHDLAGKISDDEMRRLNYAVDGEHRDVKDVVREFLKSKGL